mgnify:FL=1
MSRIIFDTALYTALFIGFAFALYIGMGREIHRREVQTQYDCKYYGHAMNNYARQHNEPLVCEE